MCLIHKQRYFFLVQNKKTKVVAYAGVYISIYLVICITEQFFEFLLLGSERFCRTQTTVTYFQN